MTGALRIAALLVVAAALHVGVAPHLRLAGVSADVLLLVGVATGMVAGQTRGAVMGFTGGLLADCFLTTPFGLSALAGAVAGSAVGACSATVLRHGGWLPVVAATTASAGAVVVRALAGAVVGEPGLPGGRLLTVVGVVGILNGALLPAALRPVRWATAARSRSRVVLG